MTNRLEVIRAGAGSGKTYDLCQTVAEAVEAGLDPARIMATTFTKKAAAELKGRIQARLLAGDGNTSASHRHSDRLELAAIGTVHSVAHFMLSRYAIEVGLSPRLEVVSEEAANEIVAQQLGQFAQDDWGELGELAKRLGVDDLNQRLLSLLSAKRSNRIDDETLCAQIEASTQRVCQLLAPLGNLHDATIDQLHGYINDALAAFDTLGDTTGVTENAKKKLLQLRADRIPLWGKYPESARLKAGKRSGADSALDALRNHAAGVRSNRRLHQDLARFSELLASHTIQIESGYHDYKTERGLLDFTDLEILFLDLLSQDDLAGQICRDFNLVLVDEFQDTNPLQLAIFQSLRRLVERNRWVGDPKQAIYGFRSTDPSLVNRIWENTKGVIRDDLPDNYRSQKGLVDFVSAVFAPVFGAEAIQSHTKPGHQRGLERWIFETRNQEEDANALARGILQLRDEGVQFGDIAVLERANAPLPKLAFAFDDLNIPYLYESAGLLATREGTILLAGMRLVLDRKDSLAAATIKHLLSDPRQDTPNWIFDRLQAIHDQQAAKDSGVEEDGFKQPWDGDADFRQLESINRRITSPHSACQFVVEALNLHHFIPTWGNASQRSSNVDSMLRHIREYENQSLGAGRAATLGGAILYLETLSSEEADIKYPPLGQNAVTLMTYHSAKGLQWPVVILSGLNSNRPPDMWKPAVGGGGQDVENPLEGREIRAWTWPFGKTDGRPPKIRTGSLLEVDSLASEEGLEQAEREAEENLRLLYVGCTRAESKLVFAHRAGKYSWLESLPNIDSILDCELDDGEHEFDSFDTSYVLRKLSSNGQTESDADQTVGRWICTPTSPEVAITPRFHSPSRAVKVSDVEIKLTQLSGQSYFPTGVNEDDYAALGDAVHNYMAAIPSISSLDQQGKLDVAARCLDAFGMSGKLPPSNLVAAGDRFVDWVTQEFPGASWRVELPATAPRHVGGTWRGTIDLILQLPSGELVVVDHKSAPIRRSTCETKAKQYGGQLQAYEEMLNSNGVGVHSTWIHFPLAGVVARLDDSKRTENK